MEQYTTKREGMVMGYRILLCAGLVLVSFYVGARIIVTSHLKKMKADESLEQMNIQERLDAGLNHETEGLEDNHPQQAYSEVAAIVENN